MNKTAVVILLIFSFTNIGVVVALHFLTKAMSEVVKWMKLINETLNKI